MIQIKLAQFSLLFCLISYWNQIEQSIFGELVFFSSVFEYLRHLHWMMLLLLFLYAAASKRNFVHFKFKKAHQNKTEKLINGIEQAKHKITNTNCAAEIQSRKKNCTCGKRHSHKSLLYNCKGNNRYNAKFNGLIFLYFSTLLYGFEKVLAFLTV